MNKEDKKENKQELVEENKEKPKRKLSLKQKIFIKEYIKRKNGTQAAMVAYDTKDTEVAKVIASENLTKHNVREVIDRELDLAGLNITQISNDLRTSIQSGLGVKATNADSLRGIEIALKLKNAFPVHKTVNASVNLTELYKDMKHQDLIKTLKDKNLESEELLKDLGSD